MTKYFSLIITAGLILHTSSVLCALDNDTSVDPGEKKEESLQNGVPSRREEFTRIMNERWENIQKIADEQPENREALMQAAQTAMLMAKNKDAAEYFRKVIELDKTSPDADVDEMIQLQRRIIGLYIRQHNINMAIVEFKNLTLLQPDNPTLQHEFAEFLIKNGYPDRAKLVYTNIIEKNSDDERAVYQLKSLEEKK